MNIARLIYSNRDICLLDDPLSALDAHVGAFVFEHAIKGALRGKTRLLVTHGLHYVQECDLVISISNGTIDEMGTFNDLMESQQNFYKMIKEFQLSNTTDEIQDETTKPEAAASAGDASLAIQQPDKERIRRVIEGKNAQDLIVAENRVVGAFDRSVYVGYLQAAGGWPWGLLLFGTALIYQGANVLSSYWIVWWQANEFNMPRGFYIGMYAALSFAQTLFLFAVGLTLVFLTFKSSKTLFSDAIDRVFHAPMSFFDTTPLGRIVSRFAKGQILLCKQAFERHADTPQISTPWTTS